MRRPKIIDVSLFADGPKRMESLSLSHILLLCMAIDPKKNNA